MRVKGRGLEGGGDFYFVVYEFGVGALAEDEVYDGIYGVGGVLGVVAYGGDAEGESLPKVVVVYLGDGDVEFVGDLGDEGAGDAAFLLEAADAVESEGDSADAYVHDWGV